MRARSNDTPRVRLRVLVIKLIVPLIVGVYICVLLHKFRIFYEIPIARFYFLFRYKYRVKFVRDIKFNSLRLKVIPDNGASCCRTLSSA